MKNLASLLSNSSIITSPNSDPMCSCQGWVREGDRAQGTYRLIVKNVISLHIRCSPESLICRNYMCERIPGKQPTDCWENDQMEARMTWNSQWGVHLRVYSGQWAFGLSATAFVGKGFRAFWSRINSTVFGLMKGANMDWDLLLRFNSPWIFSHFYTIWASWTKSTTKLR